jgi:hypothetical protein
MTPTTQAISTILKRYVTMTMNLFIGHQLGVVLIPESSDSIDRTPVEADCIQLSDLLLGDDIPALATLPLGSTPSTQRSRVQVSEKIFYRVGEL